jgi:TRAP-type mannitol/chloroaromatic compound transport system substrate-binding protein
MKRRHLVTTAAIATASATALSGCIKIRKASSGSTDSNLPSVKWRMATSWPKSLDTIYGGADLLCKRVSEMTNGRFTISPFAAGEIVPGLQVLDAVQSGTVECGHTAAYYYIGKNPVLGFGTSVPFGLNAQQQNAWLYQGGGLAALQKVYRDFNVINFPAGNTGVQMGGWFKQQVNSIGELKGLKMRIPGLGGKIMAELGVNVQSLPGGEIYLALDRGAIDAAEWVGPYDDEKLGLHQAAKYYYYPGWWEPGPTLEAQVNLTAWNKLPKEYQEVFKTAAWEANTNMLSQYDSLNRTAISRLIAGGTQLTPYTPDIMSAAEKISFDLYEQNASKDKTFREIYTQWKQFREEIYKWNAINEFSFANYSLGKRR